MYGHTSGRQGRAYTLGRNNGDIHCFFRAHLGRTSGDGRAYMLLKDVSLWSSLGVYAFGNGLYSHPFVFRAGCDCDVESSRACYCSCRMVSELSPPLSVNKIPKSTILRTLVSRRCLACCLP